MIALLSLAGLSLQGASLLVSVVSTVACVPLLAWIAGQFGISRLLRNVVLACFVLNGAAIQFGVAALSEALFTLVALLSLALLVAARLSRDRPMVALGSSRARVRWSLPRRVTPGCSL